MNTRNLKQHALTAAIAVMLAGTAQAEPYRVMVSIENLAPDRGTFQTPHWVGFHMVCSIFTMAATPAST
ncbi:MAG: hypothetical protein HC808_13250, partial [Candidatus Competibacteraceae bacterium]|nr:hypothetical protein [Candidatus Competibacteraceae bacterium]